MTIAFYFVAGLACLGALALHGVACGMHVAAVERMWHRSGDATSFRWSHAYCKVVSAPLEYIMAEYPERRNNKP